jgi:hypothetical protein
MQNHRDWRQEWLDSVAQWERCDWCKHPLSGESWRFEVRGCPLR